jgi:hypothetical protein
MTDDHYDFTVKSGKLYRPDRNNDGSLYVYRRLDDEEYVSARQLRDGKLFGASRKFKAAEARKTMRKFDAAHEGSQ